MFQLSKKTVLRILAAAIALAWIVLLIFTQKAVTFGEQSSDSVQTFGVLRDVCFSCFILFIFWYFRVQAEMLQGLNFNQMLWKAFVRGALAALGVIVVSISAQIVDRKGYYFDYDNPYPMYVNTYYIINSIFVVIYVASTFYIFKKMIMYQRTKSLVIAWSIFEYATIASLVLNIWDVEFLGNTFYEILLAVSVFALFLSVNVKWVAYLNFKQKLRSIGIIAAILLVGWTFIQYIFDQYNSYNTVLEINLGSKVFVLVTFSFVVIYSISSLLVVLFNLPTSSVFEQKFGEVYNFQRLSKSMKMGDSEEQMYEVIIDAGMSTVLADACWLEVQEDEESGTESQLLNTDITEDEVKVIKEIIAANNISVKDFPMIRNLKKYDTESPYRSVMVVQLTTHNKQLGTLYLVRKIADGFDAELYDVLNAFISQASVSIENSRLIKEAIESERYKEELNIAKRVQQSLLPDTIIANKDLSMSAYSESANEVGGDYYDYFHLDNDRIAVIIGDVSGHGTQAAFNMAQFKGMFHGLIQLNLSPEEFMEKANSAVSRCFEKTSFVTLSLYYIDISKLEITFARAGHCPTLYYSKAQGSCKYMETKGLGLGILRSKSYEEHIQLNHISFRKGDAMLLYTDGIVEARNSDLEEYGYDRLKALYQNSIGESSSGIVQKVREDLKQFTGKNELNDDYTLLAIKF